MKNLQKIQMSPSTVVLLILFSIFSCNSAIVQVKATSPRWEPQIAVLCEAGQLYHTQHLSEEGRWSTDLNNKIAGTTCLRDKMDLLEQCKKVYPGRDITNIVESSHYQKVGGWCRQGTSNLSKCKGAQRWIKPFRCLEGPFQSDALLVPEGCLFDHIHNASRCWPFTRWNQTGASACHDRGMQIRSFAMLLPCGISLFSGVEFVCCPKHFKDAVKVKKTDLPLIPSNDQDIFSSLDDDVDDDINNDQDDDDSQSNIVNDDDMITDDNSDIDDDDYDSDEDADSDRIGQDDDDNWDSFSTPNTKPITQSQQSQQQQQQKYTTQSTPSTSTQKPTELTSSSAAIDPYFTHFDPRAEHQSYKVKDAQQRLEEMHREKVTRVMKDWSDLEERYQDMRIDDPKSAQTFKQRMTARFQTSVQALEEEGNAEKHQMAAMHQQRVLAHINQRKREAMTCYTQALTEQTPNAHRVEKCLQKLLRALHKDRAHALAHYRHLLNSGGSGGLEAAASERPRTLERLVDIDRAVNQSMSMLKRYPELSAKLAQLMDDYIQALRSKDDTPGSMLGMTEVAEGQILDKYRIEVEQKVSEKERQRIAEKQRKKQRSQEREKLREEKLRLEAKKMDLMVNDQLQDQQQHQQSQQQQQQQQQQHQQSQQQQQQKQQQQQQQQQDEQRPQQLQAEEFPPIDKTTEKFIETTKQQQQQQSPTALPTVDNAAVQRAVEEVAAAVSHQEVEPRMQHAMAHDIGHGEAGYSIRHEMYGTGPSGSHDGRNVYFTLAFAGIALMAALFVGIAVSKWRSSRHPHAQGFVEVDQTVGAAPVTPEERHVANMQINGYENPTYKYFEVKE